MGLTTIVVDLYLLSCSLTQTSAFYLLVWDIQDTRVVSSACWCVLALTWRCAHAFLTLLIRNHIGEWWLLKVCYPHFSPSLSLSIIAKFTTKFSINSKSPLVDSFSFPLVCSVDSDYYLFSLIVIKSSCYLRRVCRFGSGFCFVVVLLRLVDRRGLLYSGII